MPYTMANINAWYQAVQFRDADPQTADALIMALNAGVLTQGAVWQFIQEDPFVTRNVDPVIRMYQAAFNRIPDQSGQNFWVDDLAAGKITTLEMANGFANSQEFRDLYGDVNASSPVTASLLTAFYQNVLQREPDAAGYQFWLNSGVTVGVLLNGFVNSAEFMMMAQDAIAAFQNAELNQRLPTANATLWHFNEPPPVPTPEPEPEPQPDPGPAPLTFTVSNLLGSLVFGGTAMGDVTFTIASDGTLTFTREGVTASTTLAVSAVIGAPITIKQSADAYDLSVANATYLTSIVGYDANGHTYTILDSIESANNLNFTTAFVQNRGVTLTRSAGDQSVTGSAYADSISGGNDNDTIVGGGGNDTLSGGVDVDRLFGGDGDDVFIYLDNSAMQTDSTVDGGNDIDTIYFTTAIDALTSGNFDVDFASVTSVERIQLTGASSVNLGVVLPVAGVNTIMTGDDNTTLRYDDLALGNMLVDATALADNTTLTLTSFDSFVGHTLFTVTNLQGDVDASITEGNVSVIAASGTGFDVSIEGGIGNDTIIGGAGDDTLVGGANADTLTGGDGADTLSGGADADTYRYQSATESTILDLDSPATGFDTIAMTTGDIVDFAVDVTAVRTDEVPGFVLPEVNGDALIDQLNGYYQLAGPVAGVDAMCISIGNVQRFLVVDANNDNQITSADLMVNITGVAAGKVVELSLVGGNVVMSQVDLIVLA